jgi:hypothetical protein
VRVKGLLDLMPRAFVSCVMHTRAPALRALPREGRAVPGERALADRAVIDRRTSDVLASR